MCISVLNHWEYNIWHCSYHAKNKDKKEQIPLSVVSKELIFIVSITCYLFLTTNLCYPLHCLLIETWQLQRNFLTICWTCRCATHQTAVFMLSKWWTADNGIHLIQYAWHIIHTARGSDLALVHPRIWRTLGDMVVTEYKIVCPTLSPGSVSMTLSFIWSHHRNWVRYIWLQTVNWELATEILNFFS